MIPCIKQFNNGTITDLKTQKTMKLSYVSVWNNYISEESWGIGVNVWIEETKGQAKLICTDVIDGFPLEFGRVYRIQGADGIDKQKVDDIFLFRDDQSYVSFIKICPLKACEILND